MIMNMPSNGEVKKIKDTLGYTATKNLLEITAPSKTSNGITFTVNDDGSVTANGTSTAVAFIDVNTNIYLPNGEYILSGCPKGGSSTTYYIAISGGSGAVSTSDKGDETSFSINDYTLDRVRIWINSGQTVNNLTFYPMIRRADEPNVGTVDSRLNSLQSALEWKLYTTIESSTNVNINTLFNKSYSEVLLRYGSSTSTRGSVVLSRDIFEATIASADTTNTVCMIPTAYNTNTSVTGYTSGSNKIIKHSYSNGSLFIYYR